MKSYYQDDDVRIYHGNCRELMKSIGKVDLIVTDPPYPKKYVQVWEDLGYVAKNCLKDGGFLVTLLGHYNLPYVIETLNKFLNYVWIAMLPNLNQRILHGYGVKVCWKPILIYSNGKARKHEIMTDDFSKLKKDGVSWEYAKVHKWGQTILYAITPILKLSSSGDIVLDPFMGSGTTLRAAKDLGRFAIGCDIEKKYCDMAVKRLQGKWYGGVDNSKYARELRWKNLI